MSFRSKKLEEMRQSDLKAGRTPNVDMYNALIDREYGRENSRVSRKYLISGAVLIACAFLLSCSNPVYDNAQDISMAATDIKAPAPNVAGVVLVPGQRWETNELDGNDNPIARLEIRSGNGDNYTLTIRIDGNQNTFIVEGSLSNVARVMNTQPGGWQISPLVSAQDVK